MVAMKEVLPKTGPLFVSSFRLVPSGLLLVAFAASRGRKVPSGVNAWLSIALFAVVDASCFQVDFDSSTALSLLELVISFVKYISNYTAICYCYSINTFKSGSWPKSIVTHI